MNKDSLVEALSGLCEQAMKDRVFSGCVLGVRWPDGSQNVHAFGHDDYVATDGTGENREEVQPLSDRSIFDVASVTKSVPVSTLVLHRILKGELSVETPVVALLPEYRTNFRNDVQLRHLLTHSLDYRFPMSSLKDLHPEEIWERLLTHAFSEAPGSSFSYGNAASLILGKILARITGEDLETLAQRELFGPLGMTDSTWRPLESKDWERIVPTEICTWRKRALRGDVHDESAYTLSTQGPVGSAGIFSTVPDLLRFLHMMMNDGKVGDQQIIPAGILALVTRNALSHLSGQGTALGWELANRRFMGNVCSDRTFGKTGFTGSCLMGDPERNTGFVLLSNFTWPKREATVERIYEVRRTIADTLFSNCN